MAAATGLPLTELRHTMEARKADLERAADDYRHALAAYTIRALELGWCVDCQEPTRGCVCQTPWHRPS